MTKKASLYIDDVIWLFRDLTRQRPASLFDNPFIQIFKTAYEKYGVKTQFNLFYRTDYFYGNDEFVLSETTDAYKSEWEKTTEWLRFGIHAKQEFPDYPHVNARYEDVKALLDNIKNEVSRFATEKLFARATTPHWLPMSYEGVKALRDSGIKLVNSTYGNAEEYNGDPNSLPYGHAFRLLNNRQPETKVFARGSRNVAINHSICAYNHITAEQFAQTVDNLKYITDEETGIHFKRLLNTNCLDLIPYDEIEGEFSSKLGTEFIGCATHEQYFHKDYFAFQADYAEKIFKMGEILKSAGYEFIFAEEIVM